MYLWTLCIVNQRVSRNGFGLSYRALTETILFISPTFLQRVHSVLVSQARLFLSPERACLVPDIKTSSPECTETSALLHEGGQYSTAQACS